MTSTIVAIGCGRWVKEGATEPKTKTARVAEEESEGGRNNQQVLSSFHPCGRALLSIVMGCLPSWADELMSGFNANLPNWHTAQQGSPQTHATAAGSLLEEEHGQAEEEESIYTRFFTH